MGCFNQSTCLRLPIVLRWHAHAAGIAMTTKHDHLSKVKWWGRAVMSCKSFGRSWTRLANGVGVRHLGLGSEEPGLVSNVCWALGYGRAVFPCGRRTQRRTQKTNRRKLQTCNRALPLLLCETTRPSSWRLRQSPMPSAKNYSRQTNLVSLTR